jgi:hypothetical protein
LAPLDTNLHRHTRHADRYSPYPTPLTASSSAFDAMSTSARSMPYLTTYSAVDPWSSSRGLDSVYKAQQNYQSNDSPEDSSSRFQSYDPVTDAARRASEEHARQVAYAYPQSAHPSYYPALSTYGNVWDQRGWTSAAHRFDCSCSTCAYQAHYRPYTMASGYNATQSVMG